MPSYSRYRTLAITGLFILTLTYALPSRATEPWQKSVPVAQFDRFSLSKPDAEKDIRNGGELKGLSGWLECDIDVPEAGWHELLAEPEGGLNEFVIDGSLSVFAGDKRKASPNDKLGKI